jgi:hypothetical protein
MATSIGGRTTMAIQANRDVTFCPCLSWPHDAKGQAVVSEKLGVPEGVAELGE